MEKNLNYTDEIRTLQAKVIKNAKLAGVPLCMGQTTMPSMRRLTNVLRDKGIIRNYEFVAFMRINACISYENPSQDILETASYFSLTILSKYDNRTLHSRVFETKNAMDGETLLLVLDWLKEITKQYKYNKPISLDL